uniref:Uncharacterized protein n=1 Tax=Timema monikensis TaxID=170555 RepID=A0A7R9HTJ1_9NEOP|nr:unnamed protein product [Timema monikensis]
MFETIITPELPLAWPGVSGRGVDRAPSSQSVENSTQGINYNLAYVEPVPAMTEPFYEVHGDAAAERGNLDQLNTTIDTFQISPPRRSEMPSCSIADGDTIESILPPHLESPSCSLADGDTIESILPPHLESPSCSLADGDTIESILPPHLESPSCSLADGDTIESILPPHLESPSCSLADGDTIESILPPHLVSPNLTSLGEARNGSCSTLHLRCKMCGVLETLRTENPNSPMNVNTTMVAGIINTGQGFVVCSSRYALYGQSYVPKDTPRSW